MQQEELCLGEGYADIAGDVKVIDMNDFLKQASTFDTVVSKTWRTCSFEKGRITISPCIKPNYKPWNFKLYSDILGIQNCGDKEVQSECSFKEGFANPYGQKHISLIHHVLDVEQTTEINLQMRKRREPGDEENYKLCRDKDGKPFTGKLKFIETICKEIRDLETIPVPHPACFVYEYFGTIATDRSEEGVTDISFDSKDGYEKLLELFKEKVTLRASEDNKLAYLPPLSIYEKVQIPNDKLDHWGGINPSLCWGGRRVDCAKVTYDKDVREQEVGEKGKLFSDYSASEAVYTYDFPEVKPGSTSYHVCKNGYFPWYPKELQKHNYIVAQRFSDNWIRAGDGKTEPAGSYTQYTAFPHLSCSTQVSQSDLVYGVFVKVPQVVIDGKYSPDKENELLDAAVKRSIFVDTTAGDVMGIYNKYRQKVTQGDRTKTFMFKMFDRPVKQIAPWNDGPQNESPMLCLPFMCRKYAEYGRDAKMYKPVSNEDQCDMAEIPYSFPKNSPTVYPKPVTERSENIPMYPFVSTVEDAVAVKSKKNVVCSNNKFYQRQVEAPYVPCIANPFPCLRQSDRMISYEQFLNLENFWNDIPEIFRKLLRSIDFKVKESCMKLTSTYESHIEKMSTWFKDCIETIVPADSSAVWNNLGRYEEFSVKRDASPETHSPQWIKEAGEDFQNENNANCQASYAYYRLRQER